MVQINDFNTNDWQSVIAESDQKECNTYSRLFFEEARKAKEAGDAIAQDMYSLLGGITSLIFNLDMKEKPFAPLATWGNSRTMIVDDLTDEQLIVLTEVATQSQIADPEMHARIADILWITKGNHRIAMAAVDAYIASANTLEDPEHFVSSVQRIERAIQLAASLGKRNELYRKTIDHIEALLEKYQEQERSFLPATLMELLLEQRQGEREKYARLAETLAERAVDDQDWHRARTYQEIWGRWIALINDPAKKYACLEAIADTYVKQADMSAHGPNPSHMVAAMHLQSAIEVLRKIPGTQERVKQIHLTLIDYREKALDEMGTIEIPLDVTAFDEQARERVKGKTLLEGLFALAFIGPVPRVESLRQLVEEHAQRFPFGSLVPVQAVNSAGKMVGNRPSILTDNVSEAEAAIWAEMFRHAAMQQQVHVVALVEPAREQLMFEHPVRVSDVLPIVAYNPFVPPGREMIYARGLHAGLTGDTLVAAHLLAPQMENSIRSLLVRSGKIVSGLDDQGIQDEFSLNTVLRNYQTDLIAILGKDLWFDLCGLLVERFGSNMRNNLAHGLMNYEELISPQSTYIWWLALRLCCSFFLAASAKVQENGQGEE
jgi:Domain of unknown function (DUF4209)